MNKSNDEETGLSLRSPSPSSSPPLLLSHTNKWSSPAFDTKQESQDYLSSIAPLRDLVCPITQELFKSPVVATDGQTYEKQAIKTWFQSQKNSTGSIRSPVTNAYIDVTTNGMILVENKAVAGMVRQHQEKLGEELCLRCQAVWDYGLDSIADDGFRIKGLVEAGADLSVKGCQGGNTAFMALLQSSFFSNEDSHTEEMKFALLRYFIAYNAPVTLTNNEGKDCITITEELMTKISKDCSSDEDKVSLLIQDYERLLKQLKQRSQLEEKKRKTQSKKRDELNNEHRERQRVLSENARNNQYSINNNDTLVSETEGWGYFPCLPVLLFQGNVPEPPASFAAEEMVTKNRLQFIVRCTAGIVFLFWCLI